MSGCCTAKETAKTKAELPAHVAQILAAHRAAFRDFLIARVRDRSLAEDVLHDVYARAIDHLDELRDEESAVAWFYRSLRNALIDHVRRVQSAARALDAFADESESSLPALDRAPAKPCPCVTRIARSLKPEYATILQRVDVEGMSLKAFAADQGISASNAAVRAFRAREALRRQVMVVCGTCADGGCVDCTCPDPAAAK